MSETNAPLPDAPPPPPDESGARALAIADGHARAALAILGDLSTVPDTARLHLRAGAQALAQLVARGVPSASAAEILTTASETQWPGARTLAAFADADGAAWADTHGAPESVSAAQRRALRGPAQTLAALVAVARPRIVGPGPQRAERRRLWRGAALTVAVLASIVVALAVTAPDPNEGPWRGAYYQSRDFSGPPTIRRDGDLRFSWAEASPLPDHPRDAFSVRWDTCLVLDTAGPVAFRLSSDDGSLLLVDGTRVLDNWGVHGIRTQGQRVELAAGVHHLRVEYFDQKEAASVALVASLHGERPTAIPGRVLRYPAEPFDAAAPCAQSSDK